MVQLFAELSINSIYRKLYRLEKKLIKIVFKANFYSFLSLLQCMSSIVLYISYILSKYYFYSKQKKLNRHFCLR